MVSSSFLISSFVQLSTPIVGVISGTAKLLRVIDLFMAFNSDLQILLTLLLYSLMTRSLCSGPSKPTDSSIPRYL